MNSPSVGTPDLNTALAKAQSEFDPIVCNKTAKVFPKDGRPGYSFNYADLQAVIAATQPALSKNGLAVSDQIESGEDGEKPKITVYLRHITGQTICSSLPLSANLSGRAQELGSLISFYRRYLLSGLLHVSSQEDDDANASDGNEASISEARNSPVARPQPTPTQRPTPTPKPQATPQPRPQNQAPGVRVTKDMSDLELKTYPIPGNKHKGQTLSSMDQNILGEYLHWVRTDGPQTWAYKEFVGAADEWFKRQGPLPEIAQPHTLEDSWPTMADMPQEGNQ